MYEVIMTNTQRAYTTALLQPLKKKSVATKLENLAKTALLYALIQKLEKHVNHHNQT